MIFSPYQNTRRASIVTHKQWTIVATETETTGDTDSAHRVQAIVALLVREAETTGDRDSDQRVQTLATLIVREAEMDL